MEWRSWKLGTVHVVLLGSCLLLSHLDTAIAGGPCGENQFQPRHHANKGCIPCSDCEPGEKIVRKCTATRDTKCAPLMAAVGETSLDIRCTGSLGVYLDGNSALGEFKKMRKRKGHHIKRLRWKKLKATSCTLAKKFAKRVLRVRDYRRRECPADDQFVWENDRKTVTCHLCSQCPDGSHVIRSCGGRQDTVCSFPPVPDMVELFTFSCPSTATRVHIYNAKPHSVSQFTHDTVQGKLSRRLCASLKANLPSSAKHDKDGRNTSTSPTRKLRNGPTRKGNSADDAASVFPSSTTTTATSTTTPSTTTTTTTKAWSTESPSVNRSELNNIYPWVHHKGSSDVQNYSSVTVVHEVASLASTSPMLYMDDDVDKEEQTPEEDVASGQEHHLTIIISSVAVLAIVLLVITMAFLAHRLHDQSKTIKNRKMIAAASREHDHVYFHLSTDSRPAGSAFLERAYTSSAESESAYSSLNGSEASSSLELDPDRPLNTAGVTTFKRVGNPQSLGVSSRGRPEGFGSGRSAQSLPRISELDSERNPSGCWSLDIRDANRFVSTAAGQAVAILHQLFYDIEDDLTGNPCVERMTSFKPTENPQVTTVRNVRQQDPQSSKFSSSSDDTDTALSTHTVTTTTEHHPHSYLTPVLSEERRRPDSSLTYVSELDEGDSNEHVAFGRKDSCDSDFSSGTDESIQVLLNNHRHNRNSLVSSSSRSTNVSLEICIPLNNEVKISALPADWLQKRNDVPPENVLWNYSASATTQTDDAGESQERPIFASFWQGKKSFSYTGGIFHIENSDVRLEVPAGAVPSATYVDMVGATYTNLAHIRTVLGMSCDEVIMSPAAELHAGTGFRFAKPVHLYLPTALPSAFPEELIKVYHFHEAENGDLTVKLLPSRAAYEKHHEERKNDMNADGVEPRGDTRLDEFSGYFERLPSGELRVTTSSFSGYVCSACRQQVDKMPQIQLLATGSHVQIAEDSWQVDIRLALWDRKINIADFQRDHLQGQTPVAPPQTLNVVDDFQESLVQLQLTVYGPYQARWRHALRPHSHDPVFAVVKDFLLNELLHCQTEDAPRFEEWLIENVPERVPGPVFQCYIDATNTYPEPQEQGATCAERGREKKVTLFVSGVKKTSSEYDEWAATAHNGAARNRSTTPKLNRETPGNGDRQQTSRQQNTAAAGTGNGVRYNTLEENPPSNTQLGVAEVGDGPVREQDTNLSSDIDDCLLFGDGNPDSDRTGGGCEVASPTRRGGDQANPLTPTDRPCDQPPLRAVDANTEASLPVPCRGRVIPAAPAQTIDNQTPAVVFAANTDAARRIQDFERLLGNENSDPGCQLPAFRCAEPNCRHHGGAELTAQYRQQFWENRIHPDALMNSVAVASWRLSDPGPTTGHDFTQFQGQEMTSQRLSVTSCPEQLGTPAGGEQRQSPAEGQVIDGGSETAVQTGSGDVDDGGDGCGLRHQDVETQAKRTLRETTVHQETRRFAEKSIIVNGRHH